MDIMIFGRYIIILIYVASVYIFGIILKCSHILGDFWGSFSPEDKRNEYDYIVVGAGSAGSIMAHRLASNDYDQILLLEAGKDKIDLLNIPSLGLLLQQTPYDWTYVTIPQKNACLGLNQNASLWPMGKILGGTGMLNNMLYIRGHEEDFNEWFRDKENYNYSDILHYFKKMENEGLKDSGKPIFITDLIFSTVLPNVVLNAAERLGYSILTKNYDSRPGFNIPKATLHQGQRWTSAENLKIHNLNLVIKTNCVVEKILFDFNFEAKGVEYDFLGQKFKAYARKAVILSAGVIGSPKLLMLSGIGPKDHLYQLGIPVTQDLPVGNNLEDHLTTGFDLVLLNQTLNLGLESILSPFSLLEYFFQGSGPWTTTGCEAMALFNTKHSESSERPDLQFMIMPLGITEDDGHYLRKLIGISDKIWSKYFSKINSKTMTILPIVLHPKSKGTVRLQSKNPTAQPLIDPQYLTEPADIEILIKGIEIIKSLVATEEFKMLGAEFNTAIFPGCENYLFDSYQYWECYLRHLTVTSYHPVGTCKMGKAEDSSTVVDFNFQVKGTNKLFVVDGSVLPSLPSGNINGPIMMLAEMAADSVKKAYYLSVKKCAIIDIFIPKNKTC